MNYEGEPVLDFTEVEGAGDLQQPVRTVEFTVGGVKLVLPRGADDPTPDNVLKLGGMEINVDTGELKV